MLYFTWWSQCYSTEKLKGTEAKQGRKVSDSKN